MRRTALIKSNNPHLAGGEKKQKIISNNIGTIFFSFCERTFLIWYEPI